MPDRYAVIGHPIGHTKSPLIDGLFAPASGQDMVYTAIDGRPDGFASDVDALRAAGGRGMNVTAPFKLDAFAYELAYGKGLTPFLRLAQQAGVRQLADGVGMLIEQAADAFDWWRGVRPETQPVIARLTVPLA